MRDRGIDVPRSMAKERSGRFAPMAAATRPEFRIEISGWDPVTPLKGDARHA
jgi:hypothetical protein